MTAWNSLLDKYDTFVDCLIVIHVDDGDDDDGDDDDDESCME